MKKSLILFISVFHLLFLFACVSNSQITTTEDTEDFTAITTLLTTNVMTTSFSTITTMSFQADYMGAPIPTDSLRRFPPTGFLSTNLWFWHGSPVFSPNGDEMYFAKYFVQTDVIEIWVTTKSDGIWSDAHKLEIEGISGMTNNPYFLLDPDILYFLNVTENGEYIIYKAERIDGIWKNAIALDIPITIWNPSGWAFSISENQNVYFNYDDRIFVSRFSEGMYLEPEEVLNVNQASATNNTPTVAFDESYLLFSSDRPGGYGLYDIYISFRDDQGQFMDPINLGSQVNTSQEESGMTLSKDGLYLFFTTHKSTDRFYNPYWIRLDQLSVFQQASD